MKIKNILIIIGIVIILIIVGWWWLGQTTETITPVATQDPTIGDFFPVEVIKNTINAIVTTTQDGLQNLISVDEEKGDGVAEDQSVRQVVGEPVADYGFVTYQGTSTLFYVEQETGHIFVVASGTPIRLSNKSIPRVKDVVAAENSAKYYFYISSLDEQNNLVFQKGELLKATSSDLALTALDPRINTLVVSPKGDQVFLIKENEDGVIGQIANLNLEVPTTIFSSPFKEWVVEWVSADKISFQTKASSGINGSIYLLDTKTKGFAPILTNIPGLMGKLNNTSNTVIYSQSDKGEIISSVKKLGIDFYDLPIKIVIDKCGWVKTDLMVCGISKSLLKTNQPDSWYQGLVSFNDEIWFIDTNQNTALLVNNQGSNALDVINLKNSGKLVYFQNKTDGSLWSFDLTSFDF